MDLFDASDAGSAGSFVEDSSDNEASMHCFNLPSVDSLLLASSATFASASDADADEDDARRREALSRRGRR